MVLFSNIRVICKTKKNIYRTAYLFIVNKHVSYEACSFIIVTSRMIIREVTRVPTLFYLRLLHREYVE